MTQTLRAQVEVFAEIPESERAILLFDEIGTEPSRGIEKPLLRVAASATHLYVSGVIGPGPWYRLQLGKRGLYGFPRQAVRSIALVRSRSVPITLEVLGGAVVGFFLFEPRKIPGKPLLLAIGVILFLLVVLLENRFFPTRSFSLRLDTPYGSFQSVTARIVGRKRIEVWQARMARLREIMLANGLPVSPL